jgi:predicted nuclease of predicted toxin-antitoxin system
LRTHTYADATDAEVIQLAQQLDAVLLTVDMDFANIQRYPPQTYGGIIVIRYQSQADEAASNTLKTVLEELYREKLRGCLVVIAEGRYKVR